ncbi:MAG: hypothetical protein ACPG49_04900 [Chitinophagales bacterium]
MKNENLIIAKENGIQEFKIIFHWDCRYGIGHCLVRLYIEEDSQRTVFVLTALKSSQGGANLTYHFYELKEALLEYFGAYIKVPDEQIEWYQQHSGFSVHDGLGGTTILKVNPSIVYKFDNGNMPKTSHLFPKNFSDIGLGYIEVHTMRPIFKELEWELEDWLSDADYE